MKKMTTRGALVAAGLFGAFIASGAAQRFEAEKVLKNPDALLENRFSDSKWNLWSTDQDAARKWSEGVVVQGIGLKADRTPGEGMPILSFNIPVPDKGQYELTARITRTVGLSIDGGKSWKRFTGGVVATGIEGGKGPFEFQIANCFVNADNPGACYVDYFELSPVGAATKPAEGGVVNPSFEEGSSDRVAGWSFWKRDNAASGKAELITDAPRSGQNAVKISHQGKADWAFSPSRSLAVTPGDEYSVAAWVRNLGDKPFSASVQLVLYADNKVISYDRCSMPVGKAGKDWTSFSSKFIVPEGVNKAALRLSGSGECDFALDDLDLKHLGKRDIFGKELSILNGGFEDALKNWVFWSRDNHPQSKAEAVRDAAEGAGGCRIVSAGEKDWSFTGVSYFPAAPGDRYKLSLQARNNTGVKAIARAELVGYRGGKVVRYDLGQLPFGEDKEFKTCSGIFTVPEGIDTVAVRLSGSGKCDLTVDALKLEKVAAPKENVYRPVREGAAKRMVEKVDRALIAFPTDEGMMISWRLLESDAKDIAFDLFRIVDGKSSKLNSAPLKETTDFIDAAPVKDARYRVAPAAGFTGPAGECKAWDKPYQRFELSDPKGRVDKVGIADLDGDGRYDYVVRITSGNIDPWHIYWKKSPDTYKLEAFNADGKRLWTYDQGWSIERGIWYSPYMVYDFNGDGKAEVAVKMGEGDPRDPDGRVTGGNEYLAILDGMTGKPVAKVPWPNRDGFDGEAGYNLASRNQLAMAYLDGKTPAILALRGTYTTMKAEAWRLNDKNEMERIWVYDSRDYPERKYQGQGSHSTRCADIDGDGRDEVILGSAALDDDGRPLWTTGLGHPDYLYVTDAVPENPGLEVITVIETRCPAGGGLTVADAKTGKPLWQLKDPTNHVHHGFAADLDPRFRGFEVGGVDTDASLDRKKLGSWVFKSNGELLYSGDTMPERESIRTIFWDADLQREVVRGMPCRFGGAAVGGVTEGTMAIVADVLGDWREEMLTSAKGEMRIYPTPIPAMDRRVCLMQDPIYRNAIVPGSMGYYYDPTLTYLPVNVSPNLSLSMFAEGMKKSFRIVVSAPLDRGLEGELKLLPPANLKLEKDTFPIKLAAGGIEVLELKSELAGTAKGMLKAELKLSDGTVLRGRQPLSVKPVEVNIAPPAGFLAEAENFIDEKGGKAVVREDKVGVNGKCISHWDAKGHELSWKIDLPRDGKYILQLRYTGERSTRDIFVNGEKLGTFVIPASGGLGASAIDWELYSVGHNGGQLVLDLKSGPQLIRMVNTNGEMLNLDYLSLVPAK
ncbi:MAG: carbohydrate binding domain-containing protein [Victivallaceae bacterium]